jgi:hypothetical protein
MNKKELRGTNKLKLRKGYNSLNNLKKIVQKDKEEDYILGVDKQVEKNIKQSQEEYNNYKSKSHT